MAQAAGVRLARHGARSAPTNATASGGRVGLAAAGRRIGRRRIRRWHRAAGGFSGQPACASMPLSRTPPPPHHGQSTVVVVPPRFEITLPVPTAGHARLRLDRLVACHQSARLAAARRAGAPPGPHAAIIPRRGRVHPGVHRRAHPMTSTTPPPPPPAPPGAAERPRRRSGGAAARILLNGWPLALAIAVLAGVTSASCTWARSTATRSTTAPCAA